ncbi:MAG: hypothetical protein Q9M43_04470 [Sulfurimonas sp.]|nr:hypothetical protein [Sulfurimonas sp.]
MFKKFLADTRITRIMIFSIFVKDSDKYIDKELDKIPASELLNWVGSELKETIKRKE